MNASSIVVDGMLSGTGIRDAVAGGYFKPAELNLSAGLTTRIARWLQRYENAHYFQFQDDTENAALDTEGIAIARALRCELPGVRVEYFSNAQMKPLTA